MDLIRVKSSVLALFALFAGALQPALGATQVGGIRYVDLESARQLASSSGKPVVIVIGAVWCVSCREFGRNTLPAAQVQAMASEFHWAYIEVDRNLSLARSFGVRATPSIFVETSDGVRVGQARGALRPDEFARFLTESQRRAAGHPASAAAPSPLSVEDRDRTVLTWSPTGYRGRAICFSHVGYGPLDLPSQAPGQVLRLGLRPRTPSTLAQGEFEIGWTESLANIFSFRENDYRLDYGTLNSVLSVAYGATDTVLVELEYSDLERFDSILDPITNAFHDAFGFGDSGREQFSDGDNAMFLRGEGGAPDVNNETAGSLARDLGLTLQHNLTCGTETWPALSYALTGRYHSGGESDLTGDNPWSFGLSLSASRRFHDDFYVYGGLAYAVHGLDNWNGIALKESQLSGILAVEWRYRPENSFILQYLVSEGVAETRDPFDENAHEIGIGFKHEVSRGTVLEIGLIENAVTADNSPDFGIHLGLKYRF